MNANKICPSCGAQNKVTAKMCAQCLTPLLNVKAGAAVPDPTPRQNLTMRFHIYDRVAGTMRDDQRVEIPETDGEFIVGREDGAHKPHIDLKPFALQRSVGGITGGKGYLISRSHALLFRRGRMLQIMRHPESSKKLFLWPMGDGNGQRELHPDKPENLQHGDVIVFGNPINPEAVIVRLICE